MLQTINLDSRLRGNDALGSPWRRPGPNFLHKVKVDRAGGRFGARMIASPEAVPIVKKKGMDAEPVVYSNEGGKP
jgi:hypothetical protein